MLSSRSVSATSLAVGSRRAAVRAVRLRQHRSPLAVVSAPSSDNARLLHSQSSIQQTDRVCTYSPSLYLIFLWRSRIFLFLIYICFSTNQFFFSPHRKQLPAYSIPLELNAKSSAIYEFSRPLLILHTPHALPSSKLVVLSLIISTSLLLVFLSFTVLDCTR